VKTQLLGPVVLLGRAGEAGGNGGFGGGAVGPAGDFDPFAFFEVFVAVSYTHLDVYKRQARMVTGAAGGAIGATLP